MSLIQFRTKVISFILIVVFFSCKYSTKQAIVHYENNIINIGNIAFKKEFIGKIKIWNTGNDHLKILDTKSDCSCTISETPKIPIAPGDTSFIVFRIAPSATGYIQQSITVSNNSSNENLIQFLIRAKVAMD